MSGFFVCLVFSGALFLGKAMQCLGFPVGKGNFKQTQPPNACQVLQDLSGKELWK